MYEKTIASLDTAVARIILDQVLDQDRPDFGGYFQPQQGFAGPSHVGNASFIQSLALAYLAPESLYHEDTNILERLLHSIRFQERSTRDTGFVDIPHTNFDSPPDTGFVLQQLGSVSHLLARSPDVAGVGQVDAVLTPYLRNCASAVAGGGFHTPNHRWVVASGLALVHALHPDPALESAIDAYLAEGIDLSPDGEYSERSAGGYNAVINRSLILIAESIGRSDMLDCARKSLDTMLTFLQPDWTILTALSRRQDKGMRRVPTNCIDSFYYLACLDGDEHLSAATHALFDRGGHTNAWLAYMMGIHPEWRDSPSVKGQVESSYSRHLPHSGVWRVRRDDMAATAATGIEGFLSLTYGEAILQGMRVHAPYFAGASFTARSLDVSGNVAKLTLGSNFLLPQLPGYWLPLNRPVAWEDLPHEILHERDQLPRPEFEVDATITEVDGGFDVHLATRGGMDHVPFQIEFLFDAPGRVELPEASIDAAVGGSLFLNSGTMIYRVGADAITIGPGLRGHRSIYPIAGEGFRVYATTWSPVDHAMEIRYHRWSEAEGPYPSPGAPAELHHD